MEENNVVQKKKFNSVWLIVIVLLVIIAGLVAYIVIGKNDNGENTNNNNTVVPSEDTNNGLTTKVVGVHALGGVEILDVYYNDKLIISSTEKYSIGRVYDQKQVGNYLVFNISYLGDGIGSSLYIISNNGTFVGAYDGKIYPHHNLSGKVYRGEYRIEGNNIYVSSDDNGQTAFEACEGYNDNLPVAYVDVINLDGNDFSAKLSSSIKAKDFITDFNTQCPDFVN